MWRREPPAPPTLSKRVPTSASRAKRGLGGGWTGGRGGDSQTPPPRDGRDRVSSFGDKLLPPHSTASTCARPSGSQRTRLWAHGRNLPTETPQTPPRPQLRGGGSARQARRGGLSSLGSSPPFWGCCLAASAGASSGHRETETEGAQTVSDGRLHSSVAAGGL